MAATAPASPDHGVEPVGDLREPGGQVPVTPGVQGRGDAVEAGRGTRPAQNGALQPADIVLEDVPLQAARRERMLQKREGRNRRELRVRRRREQPEEQARRGPAQGLAGRILDRDVPAAQFRGHAPRQRAVGRR